MPRRPLGFGFAQSGLQEKYSPRRMWPLRARTYDALSHASYILNTGCHSPYAAMHKREGNPMAIGEFGGAAKTPGEGGLLMSAPLYWFYEMSHAALNPSRALADATKLLFKNPLNPLTVTIFGKSVAAACEVFERTIRRYGRPEWRINSTFAGGERIPVRISTVWQRPFCNLINFERQFEHPPKRPQPKLLIVAPMSGHYPSLLRGTVEAFLPNHDVYITDWVDARMVPLAEGPFDLDDY